MKRKRESPFVCRMRREIGRPALSGERTQLESSMSSSVKVVRTWEPGKTVSDTDHGGVFNFDFTPDGSILGVACERKSVLMFSPLTGKIIASKTNAHTDCVNCIRFLDSRLFATCSDDTTVALWDMRYLKHNIHVFQGHNNWVKNIEYDVGKGLLLTSGFDGCIYTWDINRYSESAAERVFHTSGLMRSKLSPDCSKLLISTHEGYIIVIHDLKLETLAKDLEGFKPKMYRLMQRSQTPLRIGLLYNHVFEQERNRVEFLADWPQSNVANIISSLQIHPQGWCALSRNIDSKNNTEWTCVHDIQNGHLYKRQKTECMYDLGEMIPDTSSSRTTSTKTPAFSSLASSDQASSSGVQTPVSDRPPRDVATATGGSVSADLSGTNMDNPPSHDSLIQIRRGTRRPDGQFSFSISVHTSSGQTIEFDQNDLEDSDSDTEASNIRVTPLEDLNDDYILSDSESDLDETGAVALDSGIQPVSANDLLQPEISALFGRNEILDALTERELRREGAAISRESQSVSGAENRGNASGISVQQNNSQTSTDSLSSTISTSNSPVVINRNTNTRISHQSTPSTDTDTPVHQSGREGTSQGGSVTENQSSQTEATTNPQRTNTFMFLLQSNTGRRILNLRYMDSYTETENSHLQTKIYQNANRLLAYTDECNVGRGFIKELGFNSDGRLICSPFGFGLRLFGFDSDCNELCDCFPSSPVKLHEIACSLAHSNCVVASKFSPVHNMVVSGCLDGKIAFHQPIL